METVIVHVINVKSTTPIFVLSAIKLILLIKLTNVKDVWKIVLIALIKPPVIRVMIFFSKSQMHQFQQQIYVCYVQFFVKLAS